MVPDCRITSFLLGQLTTFYRMILFVGLVVVTGGSAAEKMDRLVGAV